LGEFLKLSNPEHHLSFEHLEFAGNGLRSVDRIAVETVISEWLNDTNAYFEKWGTAAYFLWAFWQGQQKVSEALIHSMLSFIDDRPVPDYDVAGCVWALEIAYHRTSETMRSRIRTSFVDLETKKAVTNLGPDTIILIRKVLGSSRANSSSKNSIS
jgi:hypothetical protein